MTGIYDKTLMASGMYDGNLPLNATGVGIYDGNLPLDANGVGM